MRRAATFAVCALLAGGPQAADLLGVYREAVANDAQLAAAKAQLAAAREREPQGRAGLLPSASASANATWNDVDSGLGGHRQYGSDAFSVQLTQPVFRRQNAIQYDQAKLQVLQAEAQYASAVQDLILRVSQAYFDVLLAEDNLVTLAAQERAVSEQLESAKKNFEVGTATITDTHEAQARHDLVVAQQIAAANDLQVKRAVLRQIVGTEPDKLAPLRTPLHLDAPQPDDIGKWVEAAEKAAFAVRVQQAALDIANREREKARAGHYPTLDLVASYGRSHSGSGLTVGSTASSATLGLQLAVPIYQGGSLVSREREAAALKDKALSDLDAARRAAALAARQAYLGVTSGIAQVKALDQALVSSRSALESNRLGYEVGVRINIDVLNAQQQVAVTQRDLSKAYYDSLLAQLRLKAATATLGEQDVQALNALLAR
ncbi:MAG: TolC family outer membrane protein [Rhodocyclaceae bacterium]